MLFWLDTWVLAQTLTLVTEHTGCCVDDKLDGSGDEDKLIHKAKTKHKQPNHTTTKIMDNKPQKTKQQLSLCLLVVFVCCVCVVVFVVVIVLYCFCV